MKVGIIGLGAIAPMHIEALKERGEEIVAVCDVLKEKCDAVNRKFLLNARGYADYKEMLEKEKLDVVHVCTPHYLHAEMAMAALKENINVICEKPLAINQTQLGEIEKEVKISKAQLGVCFQTRYNRSITELKKIICPEDVVSAYANLVWVRDKAYYDSAEWRGTKDKEGGGVFINQAIHLLDLLIWVCGMPKSLTTHCFNDSLKGVIEVEDTVHGVYDLDDNRNFVLNATNASKTCFPNVLSFATKDKTAVLYGDELFVNGERVTFEDVRKTVEKKEWGNGHGPLIDDFYDCVATGR
ncbi:MAG: Gfo/Idh/MocA family protein, partial [Candidatus Scatosoma sp.]